MKKKPVIGITMGDFNGIGPEVIAKSLLDNKIISQSIPVIIGNELVFKDIFNKLNIKKNINLLLPPIYKNILENSINIYSIIKLKNKDIKRGFSTEKGDIAAFQSLKEAITLCLKGEIDAIVTGPLSKSSLNRRGHFFQGQTEFIAKESGCEKYLMLMVSKQMKVGLVTTHHPLSDIPSLISEKLIVEKCEILYNSLRDDFNISNPLIGVCALNPHAGDNKLFGDEEEKIIKPAVKFLQKKGINIEGPFSSDSLFFKYRTSKFSAFLAMYHDQGLIPFKLISFNKGVNYSAGLPLVRTSPDHGVGYDIATKMIADETSMKEAIKLAIKIVKRRSH
ncbi:4-hydroxythreonine-4-phosphate dehydrogenase PdxA [candidate division KSB1 bacterium]|nr:MAG: 4-hydroxythreonine-4-phosphate dehydrogenase PdxA [candidate division KSB1 bacterium]